MNRILLSEYFPNLKRVLILDCTHARSVLQNLSTIFATTTARKISFSKWQLEIWLYCEHKKGSRSCSRTMASRAKSGELGKSPHIVQEEKHVVFTYAWVDSLIHIHLADIPALHLIHSLGTDFTPPPVMIIPLSTVLAKPSIIQWSCRCNVVMQVIAIRVPSAWSHPTADAPPFIVIISAPTVLA